MEVRASLGRVRGFARKARLVCDAVRGKPVLEAQAMLRFIPNKTAFEVERLMKSRRGECREQLRSRPGSDLWIK